MKALSSQAPLLPSCCATPGFSAPAVPSASADSSAPAASWANPRLVRPGDNTSSTAAAGLISFIKYFICHISYFHQHQAPPLPTYPIGQKAYCGLAHPSFWHPGGRAGGGAGNRLSGRLPHGTCNHMRRLDFGRSPGRRKGELPHGPSVELLGGPRTRLRPASPRCGGDATHDVKGSNARLRPACALLQPAPPELFPGTEVVTAGAAAGPGRSPTSGATRT